ncbi:DUF4912 domain-containing protein [Fibrobacter sp. UWB12]|uniref:DUF4912 domain-containing protein n=1 Tax=Fibrobacter sp. UWB12 TaxID=1896203 RepID=UPI00091AFEAF|nr:DUF4912 domain-containing protein [Fibrobacter sp. UWB12]SHK43551.1 hypothetical protein SAMN05720759_102469 [Fibrobacter sp. UWB12]
MTTKKKEEIVKAAATKAAPAKKATKTTAKTAAKAAETSASDATEVKAAKKTAVKAEKKTATKATEQKIVAKVAKKPATVEKVAAKAAPAKKTVKKADKAAATSTAAKTTAKATKVSEKTTKSVTAAKKVVKAATKAKKVDVEVVETAAAKAAAPEAIPQTFDAEYLVLMQKDPNWMQAFWEVSEERIKAAKKGKGKLVLRLFDISNDLTVKRNKKLKFHDIEVPADARTWYVENKATQNCAAALGVVSAGKFEPLVEAGPMQTFKFEGSEVNTENVFVRASLGGASIGGFGSSGLSSMSAKNWLESLSSSSGSMFSGALSSAALKSNKLELPKDSVNYGKDFFLWVKTRLIVYGGTRPDAHLQVRGEPFPLNPDGTFSFEEDLPDVTKIIPVFATDKDGDFPTTIVPIVVKRTE